MSSTLDKLVSLGAVEVEQSAYEGMVIVTFTAYPFSDGVPVELNWTDVDAETALDNLWNALVGQLPQGWPYHIGSLLNKEVSR